MNANHSVLCKISRFTNYLSSFCERSEKTQASEKESEASIEHQLHH